MDFSYERFQQLKQRNPNVKTLLAVGGWNLGSGPFTQIVGSPSTRQAFVTSSIKFLRDRGFDGLDLDWEYPANRGSPPEDKTHFTELVTVRLCLSLAGGGGANDADCGVDVGGGGDDVTDGGSSDSSNGGSDNGSGVVGGGDSSKACVCVCVHLLVLLLLLLLFWLPSL